MAMRALRRLVLAAVGERLFIVAKGRLHKVDAKDGSCEVLGKPEWKGTEAMAAFKDHLYRSQVLALHANPTLELYSRIGEARQGTGA